MTRREMLAVLGTASTLRSNAAPAAPVAVARCRSYDEDVAAIMATMFDQLGGLPILVRGKTVSIKLNLTGSPALRLQGKALGVTHYSHPKTVGAMLRLLGDAGARRIRLVESCWGTGGPMEEYLLEAGWNVRALGNAAPGVEFVNTNALGTAKKYARFMVPGGGLVYPGYELHPAYEQTDVFVSMAKLKNHETCGVTLSMKNIFGITPASVYGDDAGKDEPNESPAKGRLLVCHQGMRQPSASAPQEINQKSDRSPGHRMPRIVAELNAARPIQIAFIDGVETVAGGEGPWIRGVRPVQPGLLILGTNAVCADTVATALMGYDPRAPKGTPPFQSCDNTLLLAESLGVGSADLNRIDIRGLKLQEAVYRFG